MKTAASQYAHHDDTHTATQAAATGSGRGVRRAARLAALAALLGGGFLLYSYFTPVVRFAVSRPLDPDAASYVRMVTVAYSTKFGLPMPPKIQRDLAAFWAANDAALRALYENYTQPMRIEASVRVENGRTIVAYSGAATNKNGDAVPYDKVLAFDFVLTEKTP